VLHGFAGQKRGQARKGGREKFVLKRAPFPSTPAVHSLGSCFWRPLATRAIYSLRIIEVQDTSGNSRLRSDDTGLALPQVCPTAIEQLL